jgi:autotransporter-associated beta strand protein
MKLYFRLLFKLLPATALIFPWVASAQMLTINNGMQTYRALTNTTVMMTGRCQLLVTATNSPIPGCTINLNSSDAWFFLPNIRPSVVSATYLSQVLVNGMAAVAGGNCQLTEYAMGSVIIPQSPSFTPLQVFSGPNFVGASAQFSVYTYYNSTAALGAMYRNISSFILKRGYMATFAQNMDGTGVSQVYVAQDSDLTVGVTATNLDHQCSFVRVFPWRYTAKKGWGGSDGATDITAPLWWYDWGNSASATADREYIPIKWSGTSGTSSINNQHNSAHVLGYNEPDSSSQANMSVAQAIADWPNMMRWGLRVGAPAVSDSGVTGQGLDWLYSFMTQANSLGYRVDFIPIHYYKCGWTTMQLSNYLAQIYQTTGKPIWVTEWNNGASWCSSGLPGSPAAQATAISNDIVMLESAPFVERYSVYQWFDPSTYLNLITTNSLPTLTPAGVVYLNLQSKVAYTQVLPTGGGRSIAQFHFDYDALDSSGYANNGFAVGDPNYVSGKVGQAIVLDGTNSFIQLPPNVANSAALSFAGWVFWNGGGNGQRIFDFGDDATHYLYLSPSSSGGTLRFAIRNGGSEQIVETANPLASGQWQHVAVTLSGNTVTLYTNGAQAAISTSITIMPSSVTPALNYLGKSQTATDPLFNGSFDEVEIADSVFTPAQIAAMLTNNPPHFVTSLITSVSSSQGVAYGSSIAGTAADPDLGDTLTYSKVSGPAWLNVAADGTLTGTPTPSDSGTNIFTVRVTDTAGASAFAGLVNNTVAFNANGLWNVDADGNWSDTNNWSGNSVANGAGSTADFNNINITSDRTVTLDSSRSIGMLKFGNTFGISSWIIFPNAGSTLTLDTGAGASPSLIVNQNTATISAPLAGLNGFTKSGAGMLMLSAVNTYSGTTIINAGTLTISGSGRLANGAYSGNISDNGTFYYNSSASQILSGIISGNGTLMQASGTLTLSGNNTYTGGTTVKGGTLNLSISGGSGAIRNNLTINAGAKVNLTTADALGYTAGACVTNVNIVGGTLTNSSGANEAFNTTFNLTGGVISSSGGVYNLNGASAAINSLAANAVSTITASLGLRSSGLVIATATGTVPNGVDLNITGAMGDQQGSGFSWIKSGAGTLQLSAVNTNSGTVTVSAGSLLVNGSIKSSVIVANSGVLGGKGVIGGAVTIQSGGSLAPGTNSTSLNTLTVSNSVTLQAGSITRMKVNKTLLNNDVLRVAGTSTVMNYGGTLMLTNLNGTLAQGDSFKLFNAASYNGSFTTFAPSTPGIGLAWNPTNLTANGTLSVIGATPPQFSSFAQQGDGNFHFSGIGTAGVTYELNAVTNLSSPVLWVVLTNAIADQSGLFQFSDLQATNFAERFYRIMSTQ